MTGAQSLLQTLVNGGVEICFANPGTSEMHFIAALDRVRGMRAVLGLFEGVCTGAADGYARMAGKPAATLLHLGPGLGNGFANLHNARRANTPLVNVVGDHATYHLRHDPPLATDIESIVQGFSGWVRRSRSAADVPADAADAIASAMSPPVASGLGVALNQVAGLPLGALNGPGFLSNAACCPWGKPVIGKVPDQLRGKGK